MKRMAFAVMAVLGTALAGPAHAQRSIHLGVAGGVVLPVGKLDNSFTGGPTGLVTLSMGPQDAPMGLRLDYEYSEFKGQTIDGSKTPDMHLNSATANLIVPFRVGYAKPYLIGGAGFYPLRLPGSSKRENDFGANGGAGVSFGLPYTSIGAFLEVRYHAINRANTSSYHFVPITFGLIF